MFLNKSIQKSGDGSINNQNGNQSNVGNNTIQINNYYELADKELKQIIKPIIKKILFDELTDDLERKICRLGFEYRANSIDMEQGIKDIYKACFKICAYNLQDEIKYIIIKNLIEIVKKLSKKEVEIINKISGKLQSGYYALGTQYLPVKISETNRIKSLGLVDINIDIDNTNREIANNLNKVRKDINDNSIFSNSKGLLSSNLFGVNFVQSTLCFTMEGKLLLQILKNKNNIDISDDSILEIISFLDTELSNR